MQGNRKSERRVTTPADLAADRKARIFIFDDSIEVHNRYKQILAGYQVWLQTSRIPEISDNTEVALIRFNPDLVIVDLLMGSSREDGYTLISQLREIHALKATPILVCSKLINSSAEGCRERKIVEDLVGSGRA